jgi:hypothetical protein
MRTGGGGVEKANLQTRFEIGAYDCPSTTSSVTLELSAPMSSLEWPVTVECCSACGQKHVVQYEDVRHAPAFGYE